MAFRRSIDEDSELANREQGHNGDVEGHAIRSGRSAGEPEQPQAVVDEDDVEGHAIRSGRTAGGAERDRQD
jgi:hypothetical protein